MIVEDELVPLRNVEQMQHNFTILPPVYPIGVDANNEQINNYRAAFVQQIVDGTTHIQLQRDLMEHHWNIEDDDNDE